LNHNPCRGSISPDKGGQYHRNIQFGRIIEIGKTMEGIIEKNAGLIDDDDLNNEMIELSTHIRII
jgi:hypothetical protein